MNNAIFVDAGTTNTRVWLMRGEAILAHASAMVGVRDSARDGSTDKLRAALRDLLAEVQTKEKASFESCGATSHGFSNTQNFERE